MSRIRKSSVNFRHFRKLRAVRAASFNDDAPLVVRVFAGVLLVFACLSWVYLAGLGCSSPDTERSPADAGTDVAPYVDPEPGMPIPPTDAATPPWIPCGPPWCVTPHRGHEEA